MMGPQAISKPVLSDILPFWENACYERSVKKLSLSAGSCSSLTILVRLGGPKWETKSEKWVLKSLLSNKGEIK